jgi:two-component system chemotaxis response regulator CheB
MGTRRVLVVEDSLTVRRYLVEVLRADPEIEVVGEASDGKAAIELCQSLRPDIITMDMMLPVMSGLAATEYIMAYCPTPILIVSSSTNRREVFKTYDALAAGAMEVLDKPSGEHADEQWEQKLLTTVKLISKIKAITHPRARLSNAQESTGRALRPQSGTSSTCRVVALGTSTGGPAAVLRILRGLPSDFPIPILLAIHIGRPFAAPFAEWLDGQSPLRVAYAREGERLPGPGKSGVIVAPPDYHLVVRGNRLRLTSDPERHSCRPSVDVLFESLANEIGSGTAACLLTGMGRDGADGLLAVRNSGGATLAQDEATSVVYGMPREAAVLGAAERILPLDQFAPALLSLAGYNSDGRRA